MQFIIHTQTHIYDLSLEPIARTTVVQYSQYKNFRMVV